MHDAAVDTHFPDLIRIAGRLQDREAQAAPVGRKRQADRPTRRSGDLARVGAVMVRSVEIIVLCKKQPSVPGPHSMVPNHVF